MDTPYSPPTLQGGALGPNPYEMRPPSRPGTMGFDAVQGGRPSPTQIISWHNRLRGLYSNRNMEYYMLRRIFDAQYIGNQSRNAIMASTEFADRKNLVYNMINTAVRRYMDEMSAPIDIRGVPRGLDEADVQKAETRQKLLMDFFESEQMAVKIVMASYYQSLLDKAIFHIRPNTNKPYKLELDLVIPEWYFPVPETGYWFEKKAVVISWIPFNIDGNMEQHDPEGRRYQNDQGLLRTIEYWDNDWYIRLENNREVFSVNHKWGFMPFEEVHNIPIPHRQRGQGDGDQSVGLNEYLNEIFSDQADTLSYLANPIVVIRGSKSGSSQLVFGPRAIWELERDGSAEILTWAGSPPSFEAQILRTMQGIEDSTGLSSPAFGREIPSGVSGEAIRSILAGFNTRIGAKQTFMGTALNRLCWKIQCMWEKEFPDHRFYVNGQYGLKPRGDGDADADDESKFGVVISPRDFDGFYKTKTIFQPQNETVRAFTELEKMKAGVQSKLTTMRNLGVTNPDDEYKRVLIERHIDMLNSAQAGLSGNQLGQAPIPMNRSNMMGRYPRTAGPKPGVGPADMDMAQIAHQLTKSNPGNIADYLGVPQAAQLSKTGSYNVKIHDIMDKLRDVDLEGPVWLEGDIVKDGATTGRFNIRVQNEGDIPLVKQELGPLADRANFLTSKEPITSETRVRTGGPLASQFGA